MKHAPYYDEQLSKIEIKKIDQSSMFWIAIGVIGIHLILTIFAIFQTPTPPKPISKQHVVVKTVQLKPRSQTLSPLAPSSTKKAPPKVEKTPLPQSPIEPIVEAKIEPAPQPAKIDPPTPTPIKTEEPVVEPKVSPQTPPTPKVEPEVIKEQPKPAATTTPKKTSTTKTEEKKPKSDPKPKSTPKPEPAKKAATQPAKKTNQAPVQKPATEKPPADKPKPKVEKKGPTAEEIAAQEAEKVRQKEIAEARAHEQAVLARAKENLAKIGESRDKIGLTTTKVSSLSDTTIPQQLESLQIDALPVGTTLSGELSAREASYRDEVATRLKLALRLPDYGQVKIKLTLNRSGKVDSVQILSSESAKNKQYIEKTVPSLLFLPFGNRFSDAAQYSFIITLNNDQ